jgi:membrane protein DedA with SNARE-associated domain
MYGPRVMDDDAPSEDPHGDAGDGAGDEAAATGARGGRRRLTLTLVPIVVLTVLAYIGDAFWASLDDEHPLWLISLNTRKRYLALVVPHTSVWSFFLVGTLRQVVSDPLYYALGRWYGDAGVRWLERKLGDGGSLIRFMERGFAKASWPMVALFPNALICMLAGASGMPAWLFILLNVGGTIASMVALRFLGVAFESPLRAVSEFVNDYRWWIIAFSVAMVALNVIAQRRRGGGELESVAEMERKLEDEAARSETE